jgi:uncharacterized membrane protein YpjA
LFIVFFKIWRYLLWKIFVELVGILIQRDKLVTMLIAKDTLIQKIKGVSIIQQNLLELNALVGLPVHGVIAVLMMVLSGTETGRVEWLFYRFFNSVLKPK